VHDELATALAPILRDLAQPGGVRPEVRDQPWQRERGTASAYLYASDGSGTGIWMELDQPQSTRVAALADQVQEWAVEALWTLGRPTNWPPCPHHPDGHPLAAEERTGRAVWVCPVLGGEVSAIGELGG
jgi:hypothetical protein